MMKNKRLVILLVALFIDSLYAEVVDSSTSSINANTVKFLSLNKTLDFKGASSHSMPIIYKNQVFAPGGAEVFVLDVSDLETLWKVDFKPKGRSGSSRGKPLIVDNFVLFNYSEVLGGWKGTVFCFTLDGEKVWEKNNFSAISGSLFYKNGYIYFADIRNGLYCLSLDDGKIIWNNHAVGASNCVIALSEKDIFVINRDNFLYSIDLKTSEINWQKSFQEHPWIESIIYQGGKIFLFQEALYCLDSKDGNILYKTKLSFRSKELENYRGEIILNEDDIYALIDMGILYRLNKDSGKVVWIKELDPYLAQKTGGAKFNYSVPTIVNDLLFIGTSAGILYALNRNSGDIIHKFFVGGLPSNPSTQNGKLFCLASNRLYCFTLEQELPPFFDCTIKGKVIGDSGEPLENILVTVRDTCTTTDNNGYYNIKISTQKGNILVTASSDNYAGGTNIDVFQSGEYVCDINCMFYGD